MHVVDSIRLGFDTFIPPFELPERFPDRIGYPRNQPEPSHLRHSRFCQGACQTFEQALCGPFS